MNRHSHLPARRNENFGSFGDMFEQYARDFFSPVLSGNEQTEFTPNIEVRETIKSYVVTAEIPGMKEEDITLTLRDNNLIIEGEKKNESKQEEKNYYRSEIRYGSFYRSIPFESDVDDKNIEASAKNGVLNVILFKKNDGKEKTVKIPIKH